MQQWLVLVVNLTQFKIPWEESLNEGLPRSAGPWACLWGTILIMLTDGGKHSSKEKVLNEWKLSEHGMVYCQATVEASLETWLLILGRHGD